MMNIQICSSSIFCTCFHVIVILMKSKGRLVERICREKVYQLEFFRLFFHLLYTVVQDLVIGNQMSSSRSMYISKDSWVWKNYVHILFSWIYKQKTCWSLITVWCINQLQKNYALKLGFPIDDTFDCLLPTRFWS